MGVRVVMELSGDNDKMHEDCLHQVVEVLEKYDTTVRSCVLTTGKVTIEEEFTGRPDRRMQRVIR